MQNDGIEYNGDLNVFKQVKGEFIQELKGYKVINYI